MNNNTEHTPAPADRTEETPLYQQDHEDAFLFRVIESYLNGTITSDAGVSALKLCWKPKGRSKA
jgi:hypothetical protein